MSNLLVVKMIGDAYKKKGGRPSGNGYVSEEKQLDIRELEMFALQDYIHEHYNAKTLKIGTQPPIQTKPASEGKTGSLEKLKKRFKKGESIEYPTLMVEILGIDGVHVYGRVNGEMFVACVLSKRPHDCSINYLQEFVKDGEKLFRYESVIAGSSRRRADSITYKEFQLPGGPADLIRKISELEKVSEQ